MNVLPRPAPTEYLPYAQTYVDMIPEGQDPLTLLREQSTTLTSLLASLTDEQALFRYAPGKWSVKEALGHIVDTERIFAYRALRIGRGDTTPLPGFEQNDYVPTSEADNRPMASLLHEYATVRAATISLFDSFTAACYDRVGIASDGPLSVRALAYIIPGHEAHHLALFRERYHL